MAEASTNSSPPAHEPTLRSGERILTTTQLMRRALCATRGLSEQAGVGDGDSVAIMLRNDFPYLEAMQACAPLGAYPVSVNWHLAGEEVHYILQDCNAKALVVHADIYRSIDGHIPDGVKPLIVPTPPEIAAAYALSREQAALPEGQTDWNTWVEELEPWVAPPLPSRGSMIYTSGTTGRPKGVRRDPMDETMMARLVQVVMQGFSMEPGLQAVMTGPMYHSATNAYATATILLGGDLLLMPRFDPEELLQLIEQHKLTHMHLVPTLFVRLLRLPEEVRNRYDLSSLKAITHGAAPCPPEVKRQMIEWWGPVINEYYGSTEAGIISVATSEHSLKKPGTVGRLLEGTDLRIYDEEGNLCPPGTPGEIYARQDGGPEFTYQNRDDARREIDLDGYITNGDIGMLDEDGYLFIMDRKRDMIISAGVNIYPAEIESAILTHAQIADAAVFGIPDDEFGEAICAYIQPQPGVTLDEAELQSWLKSKVGRYKTPKEIHFSDELPREETGKIFKRKLREPFWEKAGRTI